MSARDGKSATEDTDAGLQAVLSGVAPITMRDRLLFKAAAPLEPRSAQKQCDHGLFDMASRRQTDLVDELRRLNRVADLTPPITNKGE